jgi:flagellar biosynthesis component FlhA
MRRNPRETALEYLQTYGITVDDLLDLDLPEQHNQPVEQQQANYLTRDEAERIAEERVQRMMDEQNQKEVAVSTLNEVQRFMSTKPLFTATDRQTASQLEERMAPIVQALTQQGGRSSQEVLETAYNYVVKGDPVFSDLERKLLAPRDVKAQQQATAKAKAASRSISGSVGSASPNVKVKDIRENLRRRLNGL